MCPVLKDYTKQKEQKVGIPQFISFDSTLQSLKPESDSIEETEWEVHRRGLRSTKVAPFHYGADDLQRADSHDVSFRMKRRPRRTQGKMPAPVHQSSPSIARIVREIWLTQCCFLGNPRIDRTEIRVWAYLIALLELRKWMMYLSWVLIIVWNQCSLTTLLVSRIMRVSTLIKLVH